MTEPEAHKAIAHWRHYALFGAPDEPGYGNPAPAQLALLPESPQATHPACDDDTPRLEAYDHFVVGFSGGKDSVACVLHLLDLGVPRELSEALSNPLDAWIKFEHATLNEAFGLPRRGAKETANARRRQTLEAKIFHAIAICRGDKAIDKALFEHVGKLVGLGATQTEKIFRGSRQRTFQNYLRGGAKPGRPKKIKIPHSPT